MSPSILHNIDYAQCTRCWQVLVIHGCFLVYHLRLTTVDNVLDNLYIYMLDYAWYRTHHFVIMRSDSWKQP